MRISKEQIQQAAAERQEKSPAQKAPQAVKSNKPSSMDLAGEKEKAPSGAIDPKARAHDKGARRAKRMTVQRLMSICADCAWAG